MDAKNFLTIKETCEQYKVFTEHGLRKNIRHNKNGLKKAIAKFGGKLYIDRAKFDQWLEQQYLEKGA